MKLPAPPSLIHQFTSSPSPLRLSAKHSTLDVSQSRATMPWGSALVLVVVCRKDTGDTFMGPCTPNVRMGLSSPLGQDAAAEAMDSISAALVLSYRLCTRKGTFQGCLTSVAFEPGCAGPGRGLLRVPGALSCDHAPPTTFAIDSPSTRPQVSYHTALPFSNNQRECTMSSAPSCQTAPEPDAYPDDEDGRKSSISHRG